MNEWVYFYEAWVLQRKDWGWEFSLCKVMEIMECETRFEKAALCLAYRKGTINASYHCPNCPILSWEQCYYKNHDSHNKWLNKWAENIKQCVQHSRHSREVRACAWVGKGGSFQPGSNITSCWLVGNQFHFGLSAAANFCKFDRVCDLSGLPEESSGTCF